MKKMIFEEVIKVESGLEEIQEFIEKKILNKRFNIVDLINEINAVLSIFKDSKNKSFKMELLNDLYEVYYLPTKDSDVSFLSEVYHEDTDTFDNSLKGSVKLSSEATFFIEVYYLPTNAGTIFITEINVEWL